MGLLSVDLLIKLQILPGFFSSCLFLAVYDSVVLLKQAVSRLSGPGAGDGVPRMLTVEGMQTVWRSFLLDAAKPVRPGGQAPNPRVVRLAERQGEAEQLQRVGGLAECRLLDFASPGRPLVVNFGSAT
ncbi:hypothetical protein chiPu_0007781 [Chiloscyllium punctatum]|uniref:Iodothyronine deiodinase n=2 Tax=Chiloscyllium punctatum TaxID=137246 RepID=A0A401SG30_CHIPU|nr:hypothetical protein [Chiloscyllium punctatum]